MPWFFFIVAQHQVSYLAGSLECFELSIEQLCPVPSLFQRDGKRLSQALLHKTPSAFFNLGVLSTSSSSFSLPTHNALRSIRIWENILMLLKEHTEINKNMVENWLLLSPVISLINAGPKILLPVPRLENFRPWRILKQSTTNPSYGNIHVSSSSFS